MRSYICLVVCMSLLSCSTPLKAQESIGKAEKSFSKIKMKSGTNEFTFANDFGKNWNAKITFPDASIPTDKNSLIIALHWAGDFGTYKEFNDCLVVPALKNLDAIIISPEGERQQWSTVNNVDKVLDIVTYAQKYWNVDPDKIAITGYSNGGNGSWYFAEKYPEHFSAAIPMASSYPIMNKIEVPLCVIHGEKDELFSVIKTSKWVNQTKTSGSDVTLIINEQLSHFQGCSYIDDLKKAGLWLKDLWTEK